MEYVYVCPEVALIVSADLCRTKYWTELVVLVNTGNSDVAPSGAVACVPVFTVTLFTAHCD
jgi:hypothetical protein